MQSAKQSGEEPKVHEWKKSQLMYKIKQGFNPSVQHGYNAHFPAAISISENAKDLIAWLLKTDPSSRPTAGECLNHAWFRHVIGQDDQKVETDDGFRESFVYPDVIHSFSKIQSRTPLSTAMAELLSNVILTDGEDKNLKETFQSMSQNGSDEVKIEDVVEMVMHCKRMFETDQNGDSNTSRAYLIPGDSMTSLTIHNAAMDLMKWVDESDRNKVTQIVSEMDINGNGTIDLAELKLAYVHAKVLKKRERVMAAFKECSTSEDGSISFQEFKSVLQKSQSLMAAMPEADAFIEQLFKELDKDNSGSIDLHEFCSEMEKGLHNQEMDVATPAAAAHAEKTGQILQFQKKLQ
jgi:Ca2+-binding EF-hand superfamily protein